MPTFAHLNLIFKMTYFTLSKRTSSSSSICYAIAAITKLYVRAQVQHNMKILQKKKY